MSERCLSTNSRPKQLGYPILGPVGSELFGGHLGPFWGPIYLGPIGAILYLLGAHWAHLGSILIYFGPIPTHWGRVGPIRPVWGRTLESSEN